MTIINIVPGAAIIDDDGNTMYVDKTVGKEHIEAEYDRWTQEYRVKLGGEYYYVRSEDARLCEVEVVSRLAFTPWPPEGKS